MRDRRGVRDPAAAGGRRLAVTAAALALTVGAGAAPARADDGVRPKAVVGYAGFVDEVPDHHLLLGVAARVPLSSRWAVEPEVLYLRQSATHDDLVLQGSLVRELGSGGRAVPYLVAGAGILRSRTEFPGALDEEFTSTEPTAGIGLGVDLRLGERLVVSPEARLGYEPLVRATLAIAYELF